MPGNWTHRRLTGVIHSVLGMTHLQSLTIDLNIYLQALSCLVHLRDCRVRKDDS